MSKYIFLGFMIAAISLPAQAVLIDGNNWRQLTDTLNITYSDLTSDPTNGCSFATGVCVGAVGGITLDGWIWATQDEVGALFDFLVPDATPKPYFVGPAYYDDSKSSTWAPTVFTLFDATHTPSHGDYIHGLTRTAHPSTLANVYKASIHDYQALGPFTDYAQTDNSDQYDPQGSFTGVWLYSSQVPEPSTVALTVLGLSGLVFARRRRNAQAARCYKGRGLEPCFLPCVQ